MRKPAGPFLLFTLIILLYWVLLSFQGCDEDKTSTLHVSTSTYTGSFTCKNCHAAEYQDWLTSDHYQAMHPATDSTVLGDFNNAIYVADGVTNTCFKKDGKFYINTQGEDGVNHDYEVLYTFGYFPLQQYLVAFPGGRMQATRVSWDARDKKWFHQYAGQKIAPNDWLHWTGNGQNWNTMCASCHSTNLQKNYDEASDSYKTTWSEINVSCENCHGPGQRHIDFVHSKGYAKGKHILNAGLVYGRDTTPQIQLNTCATCHARKTDLASSMMHSHEILDDLIPQIISQKSRRVRDNGRNLLVQPRPGNLRRQGMICACNVISRRMTRRHILFMRRALSNLYASIAT